MGSAPMSEIGPSRKSALIAMTSALEASPDQS